jgi:hypothetical protein
MLRKKINDLLNAKFAGDTSLFKYPNVQSILASPPPPQELLRGTFDSTNHEWGKAQGGNSELNLHA